MNDVTYNENRLLRRQLRALLNQARTNERKQELFDQFGIEIICATTPDQLKDLLLYQMPARFQLQEVVVCLIDYEHDMEHLFNGQSVESSSQYQHNLLILDAQKHQHQVESLKPFTQLGSQVLDEYEWMFESLNDKQMFKSAALLPLVRSDKLIGALLLISGDSNRYQSSHATTFLQKLSAMTAVAVENCLNQQRIKEISYQDALTKAYNRRYFDLRIQDEIERSLRQGEVLSCMFVDIDLFKQVNDNYGHHIGDIVLSRVASIIKEQVRACDIAARYGGEEFVVALPSTNIELAAEIAERLRSAVSREVYSFYDKNLQVTISLGVASLNPGMGISDGDAETVLRALLEKADRALYRAKENGRNQVVLEAV